MSEWIKFSERWPEQAQRILVYLPKNKESVSTFYNPNSANSQQEHIRRVASHWMPLPDPPKEQK